MNLKRLIMAAAIASVLMAAPFVPQSANALTIEHGDKVMAIDGNTDGNVTVDVLNVGGTASYTYGYFLNYDSTFNVITPASFNTFQGGDIIDFAMYDGSRYYTLSGDYTDPSYSVVMTYDNPVTYGAPQQPVDFDKPYYYNLNISWSLPTVLNTNALALNFIDNGNDGVATAPEPSSLLLLGSGIAGFGFYLRRRRS